MLLLNMNILVHGKNEIIMIYEFDDFNKIIDDFVKSHNLNEDEKKIFTTSASLNIKKFF